MSIYDLFKMKFYFLHPKIMHYYDNYWAGYCAWIVIAKQYNLFVILV